MSKLLRHLYRVNSGPAKLMVMLLVACLSLSLAQDTELLSDLDDVYLGFSATNVSAAGFNGYFEAVKFWYLTGNQTPDPNTPTTLYARAWYDPDADGATEGMLRVGFNGTGLFKRTNSLGNTEFSFKRAPDFYENWLSWYAYFGETATPPQIDFAPREEGVRLSISFPLPYMLTIPDQVTIGGADLGINGRVIAVPRGWSAQYAEVRLYPNRSYNAGDVFLEDNRLSPPADNFSVFFPAGVWISSNPGWEVGVHEGLAGIGACREFVKTYDGGMRFLFKACSVTVKPVGITVTSP